MKEVTSSDCLCVCLSVDATVRAHTRVWLERLLPGAGLPAWAALHSVSLSPSQPAMAGPVHGEWYGTQCSNITISIPGSAFLCQCWPLVCCSVCVQDTSSEPLFTRTVLLTTSPRLSHWTPASDQRRRSRVNKHFHFTFLWHQKEKGVLLVQVTSSNEHFNVAADLV